MLAAAILTLFASPFTIPTCFIFIPGICTASTSKISGVLLSFDTASLMASYVACNMFISSIRAFEAIPIP